jgi:hypothetical protein
MALVWKIMDGRRHAVTNGTALCGVRSVEMVGFATPCKECLEQVLIAAKTAFPE